MNKRDPQGAVPYFEAAVRAKQVSAVAQTELGGALFAAGKLAEAEEEFKRELRMEPGYTDARYDLASVQAARRPRSSPRPRRCAPLKLDADFAPAQRMLVDVKRRIEGK